MSRRLIVEADELELVLYAAQSEDPRRIREALRSFMLSTTVPAPEPRPWISVAEAARRFGISPKTVYRTVERDGWTHLRVGRRLLVDSRGPESPREDTGSALAWTTADDDPHDEENHVA